MAYTASDVFIDIKRFVDQSVTQAYQGPAARNYIDSQNRITPYDNYLVWSEAQKKYEIFPNDTFDELGDQILKIHMLYIYSTNNGGVTIPNQLQNNYYNSGIVVVTDFLNTLFDPTDPNYNTMVNNYLVAFATLDTPPNHRTATVASLSGKGITPEIIRPLNLLAATMVSNDYLNPYGISSFYRKTVKLVGQLGPDDLNQIVNLYDVTTKINNEINNEINNKTQFLIETLNLIANDLKAICYELQHLFEHWVLTEYSDTIDDYYPRNLEPIVYKWLNSLEIIEIITIVNEWSKDISVESLLDQLDPTTKIYNTFLSLLNPKAGQDDIVLSSINPISDIICIDKEPQFNRKCKHWRSKYFKKESY